jgi:alkanesulfonate monooxygenase SsuD/methylene tetrahydromethanopterin reductase-like flavin-dependent oxidoreductase (luciferase family)
LLDHRESAAMRTWYFSENPYPYLPDFASFDSIRITLPNGLYDPVRGAELYKRYLDEWEIADNLGLEVMVNEHHQTATNLNPSPAVVLGALTQRTKRARLLILGNPIANRPDPVRLAEEMAMVDNYSFGRLECGFVRGVPYEVFASNQNPARTTERMWEGIDLVVKAWTTHDGPFNWEGRNFHYRNVNIWPRPYQQPHPPVWITAGSTASVPAIAERNYVCATFLSGYDGTKAIFDAYRASCAARGTEAAEDRLAYAALVYVADTEAAALAGAERLRWYLTSNKVPPQFRNPPGYHPLQTSVKLLRGGHTKFDRNAPLEEAIAQGIIFAGTPASVAAQIRKHYAFCGGYGHLLMMGQGGHMDHDETVRSMTLFANEVYPQLKELRVDAAFPMGV